MTTYRLYFFRKLPLEPGGRRSIDRAINLECEDDAHAIREVERHRTGVYMELWEKGRMVKVFEPSSDHLQSAGPPAVGAGLRRHGPERNSDGAA